MRLLRPFWRLWDYLVGYCDSPLSPLPVLFGPDGSAEANQDTIDALERIWTRGFIRREQQQADVHEACRLIAVTPGFDTIPEDWCGELADGSITVPELIDRMRARHKRASLVQMEHHHGLAEA